MEGLNKNMNKNKREKIELRANLEPRKTHSQWE